MTINMIYTYRKKVNWKPNNRKLIVPKNSKPFNNATVEDESYTSAFGTARPLKQYRKQLLSDATNHSKQISIDRAFGPNGSHPSDVDFCRDTNLSRLNMTDYVIVEPQPCNGIKFEGGVCKGGNTNVKRTATTNINKNYSVSYNTYLQKRCKTFKQKSNVGTSIDSDKNSYKITNCNTDKCNKTYYKPNNPNFSQQGAVSSSNRLLRLKNNTINQNGASFKTAFGREAANAGKYKNSINDKTNIYFTKSKYSNLSSCDDKPCYDLPLNFRQPKQSV